MIMFESVDFNELDLLFEGLVRQKGDVDPL